MAEWIEMLCSTDIVLGHSHIICLFGPYQKRRIIFPIASDRGSQCATDHRCLTGLSFHTFLTAQNAVGIKQQS